MGLLNRFKQYIVRYKCRNDSGKIQYLNSEGAHIGKGCRFNCTLDAFGSEPYLITMGDNCLIAGEVHFMTHDGGIKVLNSLNYFHGERMDSIHPIKIGTNVYIGYGAYIMPGVTIGDNCIIGAGSIVTTNIPNNKVAVGVPARIIKDIDGYYKSCVDKGVEPTGGMEYKRKKEYYQKKFNL